MEQIIDRMIAVGYTREKATSLYQLYERNNDLDGLLRHVAAMEFVPDFS